MKLQTLRVGSERPTNDSTLSYALAMMLENYNITYVHITNYFPTKIIGTNRWTGALAYVHNRSVDTLVLSQPVAMQNPNRSFQEPLLNT
jgi:hypothetical protein